MIFNGKHPDTGAFFNFMNGVLLFLNKRDYRLTRRAGEW